MNMIATSDIGPFTKEELKGTVDPYWKCPKCGTLFSMLEKMTYVFARDNSVIPHHPWYCDGCLVKGGYK